MINKLISQLVVYGIEKRLIETDDKVYVTNKLLELFNVLEYTPEDVTPRSIACILDDMTEYALAKGILQEDTSATRDLFDTKIMGMITPPPSVVRKKFEENYLQSPKEATDYFYNFSRATNYIREDRIAKDEKWVAGTEYGEIDITINLSKPEKDPRDIAKAANQAKTEYPKCLLCEENEGYAGTLSHPARQNHRIIPIKLCNQNWILFRSFLITQLVLMQICRLLAVLF